MQEEETEEPPSKKQRQESPSLTFRVSCKCAGRAGKRIQSQVLGARLGALISSKFGLKADLRRPSLEVSVHLNDESLVIGLPVSKIPLSSRSYIRTSGLRSTVAWTLARLAEIKAGNIVLDPMCGTASILIEAAMEWKDAFYIGSDVSSSQLEIASTNVLFAGTSNVHLLQTDATDLSLLGASSIDRVICDMPFGLQHGSQELIRELYPAFAQELCKIMSLDGRVVLLSSLENKSFLIKTIENTDTFVVHDTHQMSLGDLQAVAVVLIRKCNTEFVL
ncbi:THUMP domain-containing protein 2-like [Oscarella lobularis]|uniref:THUMP domain-containing protein 2-like n=1 Tax=Oscarella lobularis TaxID=121494 RepID=UPI0033134318